MYKMYLVGSKYLLTSPVIGVPDANHRVVAPTDELLPCDFQRHNPYPLCGQRCRWNMCCENEIHVRNATRARLISAFKMKAATGNECICNNDALNDFKSHDGNSCRVLFSLFALLTHSFPIYILLWKLSVYTPTGTVEWRAQTWEDSPSSVSTDVWCTVTSHAHDPIPHNLITPSSPAEASRPLHSTTAFTAPSWPSILLAHVHVPGDQTMIAPSSEQLTTFPLHMHSPLGTRNVPIRNYHTTWALFIYK